MEISTRGFQVQLCQSYKACDFQWKVNVKRKVAGRVPPHNPPSSSTVCWNFPYGPRGILLRKLQRPACQRNALYGHGSRCGHGAGGGGGEDSGRENHKTSRETHTHTHAGSESMHTLHTARIASVSLFLFCAIPPQQCATDSGGAAPSRCYTLSGFRFRPARTLKHSYSRIGPSSLYEGRGRGGGVPGREVISIA